MSAHLALDLALLAVLLVHVLRGWQVGGLSSIFSLVGAVGGAWLGLWGVPKLLAHYGATSSPGVLTGALLLTGVILCAGVGEAWLGALGARLRSRARSTGARRLDALVGAVVQALVVCLVVTGLGSAVRPVLPRSWVATMNQSRALPAMDAVVPDQAGRWASRLTDALGQAGFPRVFSGLSPEPVLPVPAPDAKAGNTAAVQRAAGSIVKVLADAEQCGQVHEGSGWVVAGHRVVTNAHVVAGSADTTVQVGGRGARLAAVVVAFNPDLDLAILDVPRLDAAPLARTGALTARQDAVVAGFPLDGSYTVRAARIRGTVQANGDDIYGGKGVARQVYSVAGTVQPGNSGGPLLTTTGRVAGTVFARSLVDPGTGYALTDAATSPMLDRAASYATPVSTQGCSTS